MATQFNFNPPTGLNDPSAYPVNPGTEAAAREQIQRGLTQIQDFLNDVIVEELNDKPSTSKDFVSSLSANGYINLPKGLILQWGTVSISLTNQYRNQATITYPIPFKTFALPVASNINATTSKMTCNVMGESLTKATAFLNAADGVAVTTAPHNVTWIAIGV